MQVVQLLGQVEVAPQLDLLHQLHQQVAVGVVARILVGDLPVPVAMVVLAVVQVLALQVLLLAVQVIHPLQVLRKAIMAAMPPVLSHTQLIPWVAVVALLLLAAVELQTLVQRNLVMVVQVRLLRFPAPQLLMQGAVVAELTEDLITVPVVLVAAALVVVQMEVQPLLLELPTQVAVVEVTRKAQVQQVAPAS